ncbi:DUF6192 family protein [Yinghuangia aomiensis]|uniref:DUF6192 family protein n=1 Tax=Yinghuangia aomiensis TaxID=676205 RepID=UPI0031F01839
MVEKVATDDQVPVVERPARDRKAAAEVTTGLLNRPNVAFKAMADDTGPPGQPRLGRVRPTGRGGLREQRLPGGVGGQAAGPVDRVPGTC